MGRKGNLPEMAASQKTLQGETAGRLGGVFLNRTNMRKGRNQGLLKYPNQHLFSTLPALGFSCPEYIKLLLSLSLLFGLLSFSVIQLFVPGNELSQYSRQPLSLLLHPEQNTKGNM